MDDQSKAHKTDINEGWRDEALQLRANYAEDSRVMQSFVELFEATLPNPKDGIKTERLPLACLALHHLAMRFHAQTGPRTLKIMMAASVDNLPPSYGDFGPRIEDEA